MLRRMFVAGAMLLSVALPTHADAIDDAMANVAKYAVKQDTWDGPTTGPKGAEGKTIVVLAGDLKNGAILGSTTGVEEAAKVLGWTVRVLDGA